ncbi:hypothetical protein ACTID9_06000 [Brevibacillus fluminis]|uniref:hypothetical protein n=1 Tax=Brevibacillus fluminis TaxID=511487 RepID=UPI003F8B58FE
MKAQRKWGIGLLGWEGYADPSFIKDFEAKYNVEVSATYAGSTDEIIAKTKGGGGSVYDRIIVSSDVAKALNPATCSTRQASLARSRGRECMGIAACIASRVKNSAHSVGEGGTVF